MNIEERHDHILVNGRRAAGFRVQWNFAAVPRDTQSAGDMKRYLHARLRHLRNGLPAAPVRKRVANFRAMIENMPEFKVF